MTISAVKPFVSEFRQLAHLCLKEHERILYPIYAWREGEFLSTHFDGFFELLMHSIPSLDLSLQQQPFSA